MFDWDSDHPSIHWHIQLFIRIFILRDDWHPKFNKSWKLCFIKWWAQFIFLSLYAKDLMVTAPHGTARWKVTSLPLSQWFWLVSRCRNQDPISSKSFLEPFLKKMTFSYTGWWVAILAISALTMAQLHWITFERIELQRPACTHMKECFLYF